MAINSNILKGLTIRYEAIVQECAYLKNKTPKAGEYKNLYTEVSYFIHYVVKNRDLGKIFNDLVLYSQKLKATKEYKDIRNKVEASFRKIATELINHPEYDNFLQLDTANYANPFLNPPILNPNDFLNQLQTFAYNDNIEMFNILKNLLSIVSSMAMKWIGFNPNGFDSVIDNLQVIGTELKNLDEIVNYEHDYIGAKSAKDLLLIYRSFRHSLQQRTDSYENLIFEIIQKGNSMGENTANNIQTDARKLYEALQFNLGTKLSIELAIDRYSVYASLYVDYVIRTSTVEKALQAKFEEFVFQEGYFPISEANLKNGRIDTLLITENNSFLCEFKQVNLGKKKLKQNEFEAKIKAARIQSNIYINRLKTFHNINRLVFLVVFTNQPIDFKDNIDRIRVNEIDFIIKPIYLSKTKPSGVTVSYTLDVALLIS